MCVFHAKVVYDREHLVSPEEKKREERGERVRRGQGH